MFTDDRFFDRVKDFVLFPSINKEYFNIKKFKKKIKDAQTDKDEHLVLLYTSNQEEQHSYITEATDLGYEVLLLDSPIVPHLMQKLEAEGEKLQFVRVDSDSIDNLIKKDEDSISKLSDEEKESLSTTLTEVVDKSFTVQLESRDSKDIPFIITEPKFIHRMN